MANNYTKSEMTSEILQLNVTYFFERHSRKFKREMDNVVLSEDVSFRLWGNILDHWNKFLNNVPEEHVQLRKLTESMAAIASEANILEVLKSFDNLSTFTTMLVGSTDEENTSNEVEKLLSSLYSKVATEEKENELSLLREKKEIEEKTMKELMESLETDSSKKVFLEKLHKQVAALNEIVEGLASSDEESEVMAAAREQAEESAIRAEKIADQMENEIRVARENAELEYQEELIRRSGEKLEFEQDWYRYLHKYIKKDDKPNAELFKTFLIDEEGLTPEQLDEIKVSAIFEGDDLSNYLEFYDELLRVKKEIS